MPVRTIFMPVMGAGANPAYQNAALDPLVFNPFLWLDATSFSSPPLTPVPSWIDKSGNGRTALQPVVLNQPLIGGNNIFNPPSPTGRNGVAFNFGIPSWMGGTLPAGPGGIGTANGQTYYFWAHSSAFGGANQVVWQDQFGGSPQLLMSTPTVNIGWRDALGTHSITPLVVGAFHSVVWRFPPPNDGSQLATMFIDGVKSSTDLWQFGLNTTDSYFLGANQVANAGYAGQMYEIMGFASVHNDTLVRRFLRYGLLKWGF